MDKITFAIEIVVSVFMLVVLYGIIFEAKLETKKNKVFMVCVAWTIISLIIDAISWYFNGNVEMELLVKSLTIWSFCNSGIIIAIFSYYVVMAISEHKEISNIYAYITSIIAILGIFATIYLGVTDTSFSMVNGYYTPTPLVNISVLFQFACILVLLFLIIAYSKYIGKHDTIILIVYLLIPGITGGIEAFLPDLSFSLVGIALSLTLVYMFIQSKAISQSKLRERILNEASFMDSLTSLKNRRAYELAISTVVEEFDYGVIFADVNNLKFTNDHYGHVAGDQLIVNFKNTLVVSFPRDSIFRISGDEFVVIFNADKEKFDAKLAEYRALVASNANMASIGGAHGKGADIYKIIKDAENDMYKEKDAYYELVGKDKRRITG